MAMITLSDMRNIGERLGFAPPQVRELLDMFVDESWRHLREIDEALPSDDAYQVQMAAHTLKGDAAMLGLAEIAACAQGLERLACEQRLAEAPGPFAALRAGIDSLGASLALA
jgi:HPt (histidine-containing phosphotransfer) domain-containing protein